MLMDENTDYMLTTIDNPYNPFTQFELWFKYDMIHGYNTCGLLDQTANVNKISDDRLNEKDVNDAINYIIEKNPFLYKKVEDKSL